MSFSNEVQFDNDPNQIWLDGQSVDKSKVRAILDEMQNKIKVSHVPYQEGVFTPFLTENTPTATFEHDAATGGEYVRIGNKVEMQIYIKAQLLNANGSIEKLRLGGLPFQARNNPGIHYGGLLYFTKGFSQTATPATILFLEGTQTVEFLMNATSDSRSEKDVTFRVSNMPENTLMYLRASVGFMTDDDFE